jgi:hypothetical protein
MKEIYSSSNAAFCWILKGILESEEIASEVQNDAMDPLLGAIPIEPKWPKLFIVNDADLDRARKIIGEHEPKLGDLPSFCPNCDAEEIELAETGTAISFDMFRCKKCKHEWHE